MVEFQGCKYFEVISTFSILQNTQTSTTNNLRHRVKLSKMVSRIELAQREENN